MRHNGVFIGDEQCALWEGLDHLDDRICCGGRVSKVASIRCKKKGVIKVFLARCDSTCPDRIFQPVRVEGDPPRRIELETLFQEKLPRPKAEISDGKAVVTYIDNGVTYRVESGGQPTRMDDSKSSTGLGV